MFVARRPLLWVLQWLVRLESALTSSLSPLQRFLVKISLQEIFVVCYTQLWQWWLAKALDFQSEFTPVFLLNVIALQKTYDRSPQRFSGVHRGAVIRYEKTAAFFFSVVTRWLRRRGQLLDDQWWQSIAEEAVRETFSQMEPNRAWSQNCSCLTSLDGCSFTVFFSYFNNFTNNRHICQNALWWVWAGVWCLSLWKTM